MNALVQRPAWKSGSEQLRVPHCLRDAFATLLAPATLLVVITPAATTAAMGTDISSSGAVTGTACAIPLNGFHQYIHCGHFLMDVSAYGISDCLLVPGALEAVEDNKHSVVAE